MKYFLVLYLLFLGYLVKAEATVFSSESQSVKILPQNIQYFVDSLSVFSLYHAKPTDMLHKPFSPADKGGVSFGYTTKDIWLKIIINNVSKDTIRRAFLEVENGQLEYLHLYHFFDNKLLKEAVSGAAIPLYSRGVPYNTPTFSINVPPGYSTLLIYTGGRNSKIFPVTLYAEDSFFYNILNRDIAFGVFIGVLLAVFFYNLFLFISILDRSYLYYILYLGAFLSFNIVTEGYLNRLFPLLYIDNTAFAIGSTGLAVLFGLLFSANFLELKKHSLFLCKAVIFGCVLATGSVALAIISLYYKNVPPYATFVIIYGGVLIYVIAWYCYLKKVRSARYFLIAWTLFLLGTFLVSLINFNVLPSNLFAGNTLRIASMLEVLLLSFALADKINQEKQERLITVQKLQQEEKRRQKLESEKITSELKALKAQMNPHFIFNALNSIQEMFILGNKKSANEQLGKFADLTRMILSFSGKETVTLEEEVNMLDKYLSLEKSRFEKNFQYDIYIDPEVEAESVKIPPMLLQPFAENAIKHGLFHSQGKKLLRISFAMADKKLVCEVEDNGIGRKASESLKNKNPDSHSSFSTDSIWERIQLLNSDKKEKIELEISDLLNEENIAKGTLVKLSFPL